MDSQNYFARLRWAYTYAFRNNLDLKGMDDVTQYYTALRHHNWICFRSKFRGRLSYHPHDGHYIITSGFRNDYIVRLPTRKELLEHFSYEQYEPLYYTVNEDQI